MNIPIISWIATASDLSDRKRFSTLVRTLAPFSKLGEFFLEVLRFYGWNQVVVISSNYRDWEDAGIAVRNVLEENNVTIAHSSDYNRYPTDRYVSKVLAKSRNEARSEYVLTQY